ncbi:hypothetical protein L1887_57239 [Cichorium endivia]|nr:hypothetical protein L1887_57239 [Cichorium endivia]
MAEDVYELAVRWMVAAVQGGVVARYVKGCSSARLLRSEFRSGQSYPPGAVQNTVLHRLRKERKKGPPENEQKIGDPKDGGTRACRLWLVVHCLVSTATPVQLARLCIWLPQGLAAASCGLSSPRPRSGIQGMPSPTRAEAHSIFGRANMIRA